MTECNCLMCLAEGDNSPHRLRAVIASGSDEMTELMAQLGRVRVAAQRAYALLWRDMGPKSKEVREARGVLLAALTKEEQREAIEWTHNERPISEAEVLALIIDDHSAPRSPQETTDHG